MKNLVTFLARVIALGLIGLAVLAWSLPGNIVRLISKQEDILLGRYGIDHFNTALIVTFLALAVAFPVFAPSHKRRHRSFQVMTWVFVGVIAVAGTDIVLRVGFNDAAYVHVGELRLRPPNTDLTLRYVDQPLPQRSLPTVKPGYPAFDLTMRTDSRGFRNRNALDQAEIVLLGDSFTEGSRVGDDDIWASLVARGSDRSVYNLANSGDDPQKYYTKYDLFGLNLGADTIIVMLYEGNDFRRSMALKHSVNDYRFSESFANYIKFTPIRVRYERLLRNTLGPIRSSAPVNDRGALGWLPFEWRTSGGSIWTFVTPKRIAQLFIDTTEFSESTGWSTARVAVDAIISAAARKGARVIVIYAPTKARVMLPLAVERLDAAGILSYLQLLGNRLPHALDDVRDGKQLKAALERHEGGMEAVVSGYFRSRGITFVSLTSPLRRAVEAGVQTYFTYDQHWTPDGHRVVAREVLKALGY